MRRAADAWHEARPDDRIIVLDLPSGMNDLSVDFLSTEYERLSKTLFEWSDTDFSRTAILECVNQWNLLSALVKEIEAEMSEAYFPGHAARLQSIVNEAATEPINAAITMAKTVMHQNKSKQKGGVPVFVFGNLLFDPKVYDRFEEWNIHVTASDFCTSSRFITPIEIDADKQIFKSIAASYLTQTPCARTMDTTVPGSAARTIVQQAKNSHAKGVIGFTLKFCDPYLARIPMIRQALQKESIPFLMLEGDCTMGSLGQQQTRIEAFTEMLGV